MDKKYETEIVILKLTKKDCERIWPLKTLKTFLLTFGGYFFLIWTLIDYQSVDNGEKEKTELKNICNEKSCLGN